MLKSLSDSLHNHALEQFSAWATEPQLTTKPQITQTLNQGSSHTAMLVVADDEASTRSYIYATATGHRRHLAFRLGRKLRA